MRTLLSCLSAILFMSSSGLSIANSTKANAYTINKKLADTISKNGNENVSKLSENNVQRQYILGEKIFDTKEEAVEWYIKKFAKPIVNTIYDDKFEFQGQLYNSYQEILDKVGNDIVEKISIDQNPQDYVVDTLGRVSPTLVRDEDKVVEVFAGKDGQAYLTREEALADYKYAREVFDVNGKQYYSQFDAYQYLQNEMLESIDQQAYYNVDNLLLNESSAINYISQRFDIDYYYNNNRITSSNKAYTSDLKLAKEELNLIKHIPTSQSQYWIDFINEKGTLTGPQFIETDADMSYILDSSRWRRVNEEKIGAISSLDKHLLGSAFGKTLSMYQQLSGILSWQNMFNDGIKNTFSKITTLIKENVAGNVLLPLHNILSLGTLLSQSEEQVSDSNLDKAATNFNDLSSGKWNPFLTVMNNPDIIEKTLNLIKKHNLVVDLDNLIHQVSIIKTMPNEFRDAMFIYNWMDKLITLNLPLNDINEYHESLTKAYKEALGAGKFNGLSDKLYDGLDAKDIANFKLNPLNFDEITVRDKTTPEERMQINMNNFVNAARDSFDKIDFSENGFQKDLARLQKNVNKKMTKKYKSAKSIKKVNNAFEKITSLSVKYAKQIPIIGQVIQAIFDLDKLLSFEKKLTYEIDLPDKRKLSYTVIAVEHFFKEYHFDARSVVNPHKIREGVPQAKYQVMNQYYATEQEAINFLQNYVINNIESYASQAYLYDTEYKTERILIRDKSKNINITGKVLAEKSKELAQHIMNKYYKNSKKMKYSDGMSGWFNTQHEAIKSLREKLDLMNDVDGDISDRVKKYLNTKYQISINNHVYYFDSEKEAYENLEKKQHILSKKVLYSKLRETTIFKDLQNVSNLKYDLYAIKINGIKYYFTSEFAAKIFYIEQIGVEKKAPDYKEERYQLDGKVMIEREMFSHVIKLIHEIEIVNKEVI